MAKTAKKKTTKKRRMSAAQKAALKKGQAALKRWRASQKKKGVKKTTRKKTTTKKKVSRPKAKTTRKNPVSTKRKSRRVTTMTGKGITKRVTRGLSSIARRSNAIGMLQDAGLVIFAGITSGYLTSKLPISDSRVRSLVPIGAGIALAALTDKRNKIASGVSQGMVILGAVSLFKQLAPGVPMMAGERIILLPSHGRMGRRLTMTNSGAQLGRRVRFMAGNSVVPYRTAANT